MSKRRAHPKGKRKPASRRTPARPDTVVIYGTKTGATVVQRHGSSGRFTTPTSAAAIDDTVTAFEIALKNLANK
jgi:hypothetical protein